MTAAVSAGSRRPSGVGWLGDVPVHWRVANIRKFATMKTGHTPSRGVGEYWDNCTIPWFTLGDVWQLRDGSRKHLGKTREQISELGLANSAAELLPAGTVVLSRTASVGFPGVMPAPMATSQDFWNWVCGPELLPDYLFWIFRSMTDEFRAMMHGSTHKTIYEDAAAGMKIPVPPLDEQRRIADYLDAECARLNRLIELRAHQISLSTERRESLITTTATRGIRERELVPTKSQYLPAVPDGWTLSRFGLEMTVNGGQVDPELEPWCHTVLVAPNHVESGTARLLGRETAAEQGAESGKYAVRRGQIIYSKIRPALNKVVIASEDCLCSADMYGMSSVHGDDHRYLVYYMLSRPFLSYATEVSERVKMPKINREELSSAPWLRPPVDEQRAIADFLDEATSAIDELANRLAASIDLLRDRKQALITAAVTGEFDVAAASGRGA